MFTNLNKFQVWFEYCVNALLERLNSYWIKRLKSGYSDNVTLDMNSTNQGGQIRACHNLSQPNSTYSYHP